MQKRLAIGRGIKTFDQKTEEGGSTNSFAIVYIKKNRILNW